LLYVRCEDDVPATDLALEQEDEEGEQIEDCDEGEWKHMLLSSSCRLEPEDREQAARHCRHCQPIPEGLPEHPSTS
jgi:hypothetical protein